MQWLGNDLWVPTTPDYLAQKYRLVSEIQMWCRSLTLRYSCSRVWKGTVCAKEFHTCMGSRKCPQMVAQRVQSRGTVGLGLVWVPPRCSSVPSRTCLLRLIWGQLWLMELCVIFAAVIDVFPDLPADLTMWWLMRGKGLRKRSSARLWAVCVVHLALLVARWSGDLWGLLSLHAVRIPPEAVSCIQEDDLSRQEGSSAGKEEGGASFSC